MIPEDINRRTLPILWRGIRSSLPSEILREDWFVQNVILNSKVTGAVRSLLGANFSLPNLMANHRVTGPLPAQVWHRDGGSIHEPNLRYLQVFYYPQECTVDMGPTELLPGSHFLFSLPPYMGHYDKVRGSYLAAAPAGSVFYYRLLDLASTIEGTGQWDSELTENTSIGGLPVLSATGYANPALTSPLPTTSFKVPRLDLNSGICTTRPKCSIGCAGKVTNSSFKADRRGPSQLPTTASWTNPTESQRQTEPAGGH